jgi:simple sugar transport system ATP-binding protein
MALLVDDRLVEASVPSMTVTENVGLKRPRMTGAVTARARAIVDTWGVTPADIDARLGSLSGGNIQRILLGRELDRGPKLLIALNPVHGLDPKSSAMVWSRLAERCAQGAGGLVFTTDLDEAMRHGHRVGVIRAGRVSPLVLTSEVVRLDLASWMVDGW